ncbi:MAG: prepilin-type N-terminal cleavage/methylation domain-containing protein [Candidatus Eremiobacterota bacterium]
MRLRSASPCRGFSIIEMLISVLILTIGMLGVIGALTFGLRASSVSGTTSDAVNYSRQIIETIRVQNLDWGGVITSDPASARTDLNAPPFASLPSNTNLRRNIQFSRVSGNPSDYEYNLYQIRVSVYWFDRGNEKSVSMCAYHKQP